MVELRSNFNTQTLNLKYYSQTVGNIEIKKKQEMYGLKGSTMPESKDCLLCI